MITSVPNVSKAWKKQHWKWKRMKSPAKSNMEDNNRESVKISTAIMDTLRSIAKRDGLLLGALVDRLIRAGMRAENVK